MRGTTSTSTTTTRSSSSSSSRQLGSKGSSKREIDHHKLDYKLKEEPHLSGAYIRSLVKQLTSSSKTKDPSEIPTSGDDHGDGFPNTPGHQNLTKTGQVMSSITSTDHQGLQLSDSQHATQQQPQQQHKKQVRRRLHTSRPYQERLLNMAEARREIVTALKFHRASMKQANEQQQSPPPPPPVSQQPQPADTQPLQLPEAQKGKTKCKSNIPRIYPSYSSSCSSSSNNFLNNYNLGNMMSYSTFSGGSSWPNPYSWSANSEEISPPAAIISNDLSLPNQTLGLNLNYHDFNYNLDANLYHNSNNPSPSIFLDEVPNSLPQDQAGTLLPPPPLPDHVVSEVNNNIILSGGGGGDGDLGLGLGLHPTMDDEEMAEIKTLGEQHEMEWNDTLNLVTSAWWFKFFKTTEGGKDDDDDHGGGDDDGYPFDEQVMEFPAWLNINANDSCSHQEDDYYFQDPALPCMDIGEFEGMDEDWLA